LLEETLNRVADLIVDDAEGDEFPDLLTVEERTHELMRRLGQGIMGRLIEVRSRQATQTPMKCPRCGQSMQRHK